MRIRFTADEAAFQKQVHAFFRTEIPEDVRARAAAGQTRERDDVATVQRILDQHGYAVPGWPAAWGGRDWSPVQHHIFLDEMHLAHVPEPLTFNVDMIGPVLCEYGTDEQKARFLPGTASLDIWWCQGFSEPDAGSDLASLRTSAVRDGDEFVVNGQKTWTTLAQYADWMFALVRTNPAAAKRQQGISFLLIDMSSPGITVRPITLLDGSVEVNEVFFTDVRVPVENLVGEVDHGWTYAKFLLGNERTRVARAGVSKNRLAAAKRLAAETPVGDGNLLDDPLLRVRIAELEAELAALEITLFRAASGDADRATIASILKLRGSELQERTTELIADVAGSAGLAMDGSRDEVPTWAQRSVRSYLAQRKVGIYGGSSEVQRMIIAQTLTGR